MPHAAMLLVSETNRLTGDPAFVEEHQADIVQATTLAGLGGVLGLSGDNLQVLEQLDARLVPAVVQGIIGAFRGAAMSDPVEAVQIVWLEHGGQRVDIGGSVPSGTEPGLVSVIVRTPALDQLTALRG